MMRSSLCSAGSVRWPSWTRCCGTEDLQFPRGSLRMRFVTNHDKNAWDAPAVKKFGPGGLRVATVLVNTLPGVPLLYNGEEVANDRPLDLFEKVDIDWSRPREMGEMNRMLYALRRSNPALILGTFERVKGTGGARRVCVHSLLREVAGLCGAEFLEGAAFGQVADA